MNTNNNQEDSTLSLTCNIPLSGVSQYMPWFTKEDDPKDDPLDRYLWLSDMKWVDYIYSFDTRTAIYLAAIREIFYGVIASEDESCKALVKNVTKLTEGLRKSLDESNDHK